jgi:hypothetical protein
MRSLIAQIDGTMLSAVVSAVATVVLAILTYLYVRLTRALLVAQVRPCVIVRAQHDHLAPSIILLLIENVGKSTAYNVRFHPDRPIPERAFGIEIPSAPKPNQYMTVGPFVKGIPALAPGERRVFTWGQFGGLKAALGDKRLEIRIEYKDGVAESAKECKDFSYLDVDSFEGTDASDRDPTRACAKELQEVRRTLESWNRRGSALRVDVVDLEEERRKDVEWFEKQEQKRTRAAVSGTSESDVAKD